ncbi:MAG: C40 family peptidase [Clostridia bacterium]|nr:C40 family peptidase [Clostridia bacterium]
MSVRQKFIDYLHAQVGCIYVWGAQGEKDITEAWIRKKETSDVNAKRAISLWKKRIAQGMENIAAYDCSGLIMRFLIDEGLYKSDMSSRGLYSAAQKLDRRTELMPGDLVFRHNGERIHHVGVFVGNGMVIESKGRDDGVVLRLMDASGKSYWNRYGRLSVITDDESRPEQDIPYYPDMYYYSGATYVNLRTEPNGDIIGRVNRGDKVLVLADRDGWAEVIKKESRYLRGWCASGRLKKA